MHPITTMMSILSMVVMSAGEQVYSMSDPVITSSQLSVMEVRKFLPTGCDGSDYCEETLDYPDVDIMKEIVSKLGKNELTKILFAKLDGTKLLQANSRASIPTVKERFAELDFEVNGEVAKMIPIAEDNAQVPTAHAQPWDEYLTVSETPVCQAVETYVFPKTARTRSSQWR